MQKENSHKLDLRPILERGEEPLSQIIAAADGLKPGQALELRVPFEPRPLYHLMESRGFRIYPKVLPDGDWEIRFEPDEDHRNILDLTDLEPPQPMQATLEAVSMLGREEILVIRTRFEPVHLMDQLEPRGFEAESKEEPHGKSWLTRIWRNL